MLALSKEEFKELDNELEQDEKTILAYLAEVHDKNLQNPWVDEKTLGARIGGFTSEIKAGRAVIKLLTLYLISERRENRKTMYAISDKGLAYINFTKKSGNKYFWFIIVIVALIASLVSILTSNFFWLITAILGPIISEIVKRVITKPSHQD